MIFYDKYKLSLKKCINAAVCVNGFLNIGLYGSVKGRLPSSRPQYTAGIHTRVRKLNGENNTVNTMASGGQKDIYKGQKTDFDSKNEQNDDADDEVQVDLLVS